MTDTSTATKPVDIDAIEILIQRYNEGSHSKEKEFASNRMMLMADAILSKLKEVK